MAIDAAFAPLGVWLLCYRLFACKGFQSIGEVITGLVCGASLALLAPFLPFPPPPYSALTLGVVGMLLAGNPLCGFFFSAVFLSLALGVGTGSFVWQLGGCKFAEGLEVPYLHGIFLTIVSICFVVAFVCTNGIAGPLSLQLVLAPGLGALLLTLGLSALGLPSADWGLSAKELLQEAPCRPHDASRFNALAAWAVVAVCGMALQLLLNWLMRGKHEEESGENGGLVAHLLPQAQDEEDRAANIPRPGEGGTDRYEMLRNAIFAPEGTDFSHLPETDRKIVEICRKDEFERDRLLWGGGLQ
eukprot:TRINITY_DN17125_c0_g1_i2.p1 TRINITY_DN17125_c0_g1~~TRINITY_DN17125_c0_g1_i2.p1  ORF type:complete len:301 (-),score=51.72 TRINITY_DN17125_c0_g1_i2:22-924(-)